jgi:hypothetical protein
MPNSEQIRRNKNKKNNNKAKLRPALYVRTNAGKNKTENAFSPARTNASNADMSACLPLQDCIVQTTRLPAGLWPEISVATLQSS